MSADRPDYTEAIVKAERLARRAANGDDGDWESGDVVATAAVSIALSLVTLTRQLADLRPADVVGMLDDVAASTKSIDAQIGNQ